MKISVKRISGDQVFGTDAGRRDFAHIEKKVAKAGAIVCLDLNGVRLVDSSWAREVIGSLLVRHRSRQSFFLSGIRNRVVAENVDAALFRMGLCILSRSESGGYEVLGKSPSPQSLAVLEIVERNRRATARDVCSGIGRLSMPACNNRLKDLISAGLAVRTESRPDSGGREFAYEALE